MIHTLTRIYKTTHDEDYLTNAVTKGWITAVEKKEIMKAVN